MDKEKLGAFVQMLRKEQQMTQKELADKLCITDKAVLKWERGLSYPDISMLEPLSDALQVSVLELLQGERMPAEEPIPIEQVRQVLDDSLQLSDKEMHRKHVISKSIIILICVVLLLLVSIILNIMNLTGLPDVNNGAIDLQHPAYQTELDADGIPCFSDPEEAIRQMQKDAFDTLSPEWSELFTILNHTLRKEEER